MSVFAKTFLCAAALTGLAAVSVSAVAAQGDDASVTAAIEGHDIVTLENLSRTATAAGARTLARGAAQALRHRDAAAIRTLTDFAASEADKDLRAEAMQNLASVYMRHSRFAESCSAMRRAQGLQTDPLGVKSLQTLNFVCALKDVPQMQMKSAVSGALPVTRDAANMVRVPVRVNGADQAAVIDTGAGFSMMLESAAKKFGIRMLPGSVSIGTATQDAVVRLGVADRLDFGDAVLSHVVFIVLPDAAMTFDNGDYRIDLIVGLPVFVELGRIAFVRGSGASSGGEILEYGPAAQPCAQSPNLLLDGVQPFVLLPAAGAERPLRMLIDSGAVTTHLVANALTDHPALAEGAVDATLKWGGAGGIVTDERGKRLPELKLTVGKTAFSLKNVAVHSETKTDREGDIGQDLLRQGKRFAIDFRHMTFSITD